MTVQTSYQGQQAVFTKRAFSSQNILQLQIQSDGAPLVEVRDDGANPCCGYAFVGDGTQVVNDGAPHQLALIRSGANITVSIDGAPASGFAFDPGVTLDLSSAAYTALDFVLGGYPQYPDLNFRGDIDEVVINGVTVIGGNHAPDVTAAAPSIASIWPPNNKMVPITINGVTDPDGDAVTITIVSISNNETGIADAGGIGTNTAQVRAARNGKGNGRTYTITFTAGDGKGGSASGTVQVVVPHDQR